MLKSRLLSIANFRIVTFPALSSLTEVTKPPEYSRNKISIIGAGQVGMAFAFACQNQHIADEIAIVDVMGDKLKGELMDLQQGAYFQPYVKVYGGTDLSVTKDSQICIVTAGSRQKDKETRLDLLGKNINILKKIIPEIVNCSPEGTILIVTNPVDILAYATWKLSGLPANRVIGSGTNLDMSRFISMVAKKYNISTQSVFMWILGEHGDSMVPMWSSFSVAGKALLKNTEKVDEDWINNFKAVVKSAYEVRALKGCTQYAVSLSCVDICNSILTNANKVRAVSTLAKGFYGIEEEVFISLPCVLGQNGVSHMVNLEFTDSEMCALQESACKVAKFQEGMLK
ncbi:hypothetical protein O3M35_001600 [Rhynocoris fuscipes]|uniref:L-lactate dehydrogenase n=1 Tax=Rhynocoris fuscipes TaxID=488301 RepID=A0AAW1CN29_9HEMI